MKKISFAAICLASCLVTTSAFSDGHGHKLNLSTEGIVGADGSIVLPEVDYRTKWTFLGTWAITGDKGSDGFHVVYTQPGVAEHFRKTGEWPDGAVLVKELLGTNAGDMTTGHASHATDITGWFVMVKDSKNSYPDNPLWGDGWGWAYFDPEDTKKTTTTSYKEECIECHIPAKDTDWVYLQGYPVLKSKD